MGRRINEGFEEMYGRKGDVTWVCGMAMLGDGRRIDFVGDVLVLDGNGHRLTNRLIQSIALGDL